MSKSPVRYLFNFGYLVVASLFLPWLLYSALTKGKYRQGWWVKLTGRVPRRTSEAPCAWLHAVSVGEVTLLAPFLEEFRRRFPDWELVITATTRTGYELARRRYADRALVYYCPLDFSWSVDEMLRRVRPNWLILVELELWPNLIAAARRHDTKVAIINGRLSETSYRGYRRIRWILRPTLRRISLIAVQDRTYAERFRALGTRPESLVVTGSIKFDGALGDREHADVRKLASLWRVEPEDVVLLAGSTQAPEEELVIGIYRQLAEEFPRLRMIITPRHAERFEEVARLLDTSGLAWQRRSALEDLPVNDSPEGSPAERLADSDDVRLHSEKRPTDRRVLLVDTIGELRSWWGVCDVAFVGGSLGSRGGQNMIEPSGFGVAVSFGPNTRNFRDVVQLLREAGGAVVVRNGDELREFIRRCLQSEGYRRELGQRAMTVVRNQQGATRRTLDHLV